ncbi:MAG: hypothetical protein GY906_30430 [bacterium]|nr:hypothetical protein [bacterium]
MAETKNEPVKDNDSSVKDEFPRPLWRTTVHLLVFGLLVAVVILLALGPPVDEQNLARIEFSAADVAQVQATFQRTWSRPPAAVELKRAFDQYVRSEVLYREALARGLDRNDPVVRMSLVRKITMLGTAAAQATEPTDEELKAYFELRAERYRVPASFNLMQVYLNPDRHPGVLEDDARQLLTELSREDPGPEEIVEFGDALMLPKVLADASEDELVRTFGQEFRDTIVSLPLGQWQGPVASGFGLHLVKITDRVDSRIPEWVEVRDRIVTDLMYEDRNAAEDQFYAEVLPRFQVVYEDGVLDALEGLELAAEGE